MLTDVLSIASGSVLLTLWIIYNVWSKIRILVLRQQIFAIRGELWDRAREFDAFDDPAYIKARSMMNNFITAAEMLNPLTLAFTFNHVRDAAEPATPWPMTENPSLNEAIQSALQKVQNRALNFIVYYSLTGLILLVVVKIIRGLRLFKAAQQRVNRSISKLVFTMEQRDQPPLKPNTSTSMC